MAQNDKLVAQTDKSGDELSNLEASMASPALFRRYSTVTDFAKLRGWSTSQPRRTAM